MIALVPPSRRSVQEAISEGATAPVRWAYLGGSVRTMRQVAAWLGPEAQRSSIADSLQKTAELLRKPYIDYIGKLGVERDSPDWWFSSLSEKNPGISRAFLRICYVVVAAHLCRREGGSGTLVLVVESSEVRSAIARHARESGIPIAESREACANPVVSVVRDWSEMFARKVCGIGRQVYRMAVARALGFSADVCNGADAGPWVLLHNWVDARSFDDDGRYRDIFFGSLREELQQRGVQVAIVASVLHKTSYARQLIKLRRSGMPALVPQAALTVGVVLRWGLSLLTMPPQRRAWPRFEGVDVSAVLDADERMDWMGTRVGDVLMIHDVVRRWRCHLDIRSFIYTYEGHTWERGYCRAIREHFPKAQLVGYQHSTLSPMYLSHFISETEQGKVPFPDRVVTNGAYHYDLLRQNGVLEQALSCGGAFRYGALGGGAVARIADRSDRSAVRVLVAFSIFSTQAAELLLAVIEAFSDSSEFQVLLKFHPSLSASRVGAEAGLPRRSLPAHMQVVDQQLSRLLQEADVLVYMDTTAAVEALACGVPVVHLLSGQAIDMDRLGSFDGARVSAETAEGLRMAVKRVMRVNAKERATRAERWREVVDRLLPKPDKSTVDIFMPERSNEELTEAGQVTTKVQ